MKYPHSSSAHRQRGVALVVGLIFLVLVSLIATVGMRQSITQERMAGGLRNDSLARTGAETALRAGERVVFDHYLIANSSALIGDTGALAGVYSTGAAAAENFVEADPYDFETAGSTEVSTSMVSYASLTDYTARLAEQPVFLIEDIGSEDDCPCESGSSGGDNPEGLPLRIYRVTSRSVGGTDTVVRTLQTTYSGPGKK
jgi:type IV pilus assembly protein PilX